MDRQEKMGEWKIAAYFYREESFPVDCPAWPLLLPVVVVVFVVVVVVVVVVTVAH
jgi:hypothetical protein